MAVANRSALNEKPVYKKIYDLPCHDWFAVGVELSLDPHKLEEIQKNFKDDLVTQRREMFTRWLSQDVDATYNKLANVLVKIKEKEVAKTLVERLNCTLEDVEQSPTTVTRTTSHGSSSCVASRAEESGPMPVPTPRTRLQCQKKIEPDSDSLTGSLQSNCIGHLGHKQQERELNECKAENAELQKTIQEHQEQYKQQEWEFAECKTKNAELQQAVEEQQEQHKKQKWELNECKAKISELQQTLQEKLEQHKLQEQELNECKAENAALKEQLVPTREQALQYSTDFADEQKEHDCLKLKHKELEQVLFEAENKSQEQAERIKVLQQTEAHLFQQVLRYRDNLNQEKRDHEALKSKYQKLEQELETRKIEVQTYMEDFQKERNDRQAFKGKHDKEIEDKDELIKATQKENKDLSDENYALKEQIKTYKADFENSEKQVEEKIKQYEAEIEKLKKNSPSSQ